MPNWSKTRREREAAYLKSVWSRFQILADELDPKRTKENAIARKLDGTLDAIGACYYRLVRRSIFAEDKEGN